MNTLFPLEPIYPDGFSYYTQFISEEEEEFLLNEISKIELHTFTFQGHEAKRRVASFGYDYSFEKSSLQKGNDIPETFDFIIEKVSKKALIPSSAFKELLVTEYPAGSMINWHRDAPPFDIIAGISLSSNCEFKLRPYEKDKQNRKSTITLTVERRSLYIIQGSARTEFQHSITPVKNNRYSITLRTLRETFNT